MRSRRDRGAIAVIIAITVPTIVIIGAGLVLIGTMTTTRQRLQYAADAVAADGALIAKRQGFASTSQPNYASSAYPWLVSSGQTQSTLAQSRDGNLPLGGTQAMPTFTMAALGSNPDWAYSKAALQTTYAGYTLTASAQYRMQQIRTLTPRRRPPGVILVLDYSNSMNQQGQGGTAIQLLRTAVQNFTAGLSTAQTQDFVNLGLVVYGTNVYTTIEPELSSASSNFANINSAIGVGASGDTDTADALTTATTMLTSLPENFGRNIILVSDGEPCCSGSATNDAIAAATAAKGAGEVQIFTVSVHHAGTTGNPDATLATIASPGSAYSISATDISTLLSLFDVQPLCDITPGGDPNDSWAYLRNEAAGTEQALYHYALTTQMGCPDACGTFGYVTQTTPTPRVILSSASCNAIFTNNLEGVVRWGPPVLTQ